jgi:hypothetical protein
MESTIPYPINAKLLKIAKIRSVSMLLAVKVRSTRPEAYVADEIGTHVYVFAFVGANSEEAPGDRYFRN